MSPDVENRSPRKALWVLVVLLAIPISLTIAYVLMDKPFKMGAPSDAELVVFLKGNRANLERLAIMAVEDSNRISYVTLNTIAAQITNKARSEEYKRLMAEMTKSITIRVNPRAISFSYWTGGEGLVTAASWSKGIVYLPNGYRRIGTCVAELDKLPKDDGVYLVPIEGYWYIY
ncbi:MAG TPA: hypothetical protein VGM73_00430, partial [Candidatus Didemnitutus sp.]